MEERKDASTVYDYGGNGGNSAFTTALNIPRQDKLVIEWVAETIGNVYHTGSQLAAFSEARSRKVLLFKLSDLGLFTAFPLIYLKRGLTIRLNLSLDG